ncbi:MAG TPA: hypothetical protein VLN41_00740 [Candidatus Bathyarchaeia archaeon]|nr:hypothetical protein [Candidatus Bathyarchaeia archaeon]
MKNFTKSVTIIVGILLLAGLAAAQSTDPKPFLGNWKGALSIAGQELQIGLNFSLDANKKIQGTFDSITQGAMGLKLSGFEIKDKTMTFVLENVPGSPSFKATVDGTGKKMTGDFIQAGFAGTFALDKQ